MAALERIAARHHLAIVEDCCQAHLATAGGRADEWQLQTNLPPSTALLGKSAGLNSREIKVRSLYVS